MTKTGKYEYRGTFKYQGQTITLITRADCKDWTTRAFVNQLANQLDKDPVEIGAMLDTGEIQSRVEKAEEGTLCANRDRRGGYLVP